MSENCSDCPVWRSTADNNAYSPADYPANWEAVSNLDTGEEA